MSDMLIGVILGALGMLMLLGLVANTMQAGSPTFTLTKSDWVCMSHQTGVALMPQPTISGGAVMTPYPTDECALWAKATK